MTSKHCDKPHVYLINIFNSAGRHNDFPHFVDEETSDYNKQEVSVYGSVAD